MGKPSPDTESVARKVQTMAAYDPSLLVVLETIGNPEFPAHTVEVYRYGDGLPKARLMRTVPGKDARKIDAFDSSALRALVALAPQALDSLAIHTAPTPAPVPEDAAVELARLRAELAALRSHAPVAVAPIPAPVPVKAAPSTKTAPPARKPVASAPAPASARPSVASALLAVGVTS